MGAGGYFTVAHGYSCRGGFAGDEPFDEAEPESLHLFDVEPGRAHLGEGAAQEMFPTERDGDGFEQALYGTCQPGRTFDMVDEDQPSPGAQHSAHLGDRGLEVGDRAEPERAHRGVEGRVVEGQGVRVALEQRRRCSR